MQKKYQRQNDIKNLLRAEDFLPNNIIQNRHWGAFQKIIDEFQEVMTIQKEQILECLKGMLERKVQLTKKFHLFKESLKFSGQIYKKQIQIVYYNEFPSFFAGYHQSINVIIQQIFLKPVNLAKIIASCSKNQKIKCKEFFTNISFNIYPSYLQLQNSHCNSFIQQIIKAWPYQLQTTRPLFYSLLDQVIEGYFKHPTIISYLQKITSKFIIEAARCHTETFAFDQDAIKNQIQIKKISIQSFNPPQKKSKWKFWRKDSQQSEIKSDKNDQNEKNRLNVLQIMRIRQNNFAQLIKSTVAMILTQQVPQLLRRMFQYFTSKLNQKNNRHNCYFLMTNLIFVELNNKFTMSHEQSRLTHAHIQNISQIIRILGCIFQGIRPDGDKYRFLAINFAKYKEPVQQFYKKILKPIERPFNINTLAKKLLKYSENCVIFSFQDLKCVLQILLQSEKTKQILPNAQLILSFLKDENIQKIYQPKAQIRYKNGLNSPQNIYFFYQSSNPSSKNLIQNYMAVQNPLKQIDHKKTFLFHNSNLNVTSAIQLQKTYHQLSLLPINQIKKSFAKLSSKFNQLKLKNTENVINQLKNAFKIKLQNALERKQCLLYNRNQLIAKMQQMTLQIDYFVSQLKGISFYDKISQSFINNISFKIHLTIQKSLFRIVTRETQLRKLQLSSLLINMKNENSSSVDQQNFILCNSFKLFESVKELLRCISRNEITKAALRRGRQTEQFNSMFKTMCGIIVTHIDAFIKQKDSLQALSIDKIGQCVIQKLQNNIYSRGKSQGALQADKLLLLKVKDIDKQGFYQKDIEQLGMNREFLVEQGVQKLKQIMLEDCIMKKYKEFNSFFKIIFTIMGFTMAKNKISAQNVNPVMQFLILQCADLPHHQCLFALQSLKWKQTPQESYNLTLYQSSLTYIMQNMASDYPKNKSITTSNISS